MKPLDGLRVIDLTQAMAAPYCTMNLADLGADVIKVEPPGGEEQRRGATSRHGHSGSFMAINRNKRGITLDLKTPEGVEVMHRLVCTADVFVQNYRPGAAGRLGVDYETLKRLNPRLIYCSVSGFGGTGPYASRGGYDLIAQGMSGIISVTGEEDGAPAKAGIPVSDLAAGLFGAYGRRCAPRMAGSPSARPTTSCSTDSVARSAVPTCSTTRASPAARSGWSTATRSPPRSRRRPRRSRALTGWIGWSRPACRQARSTPTPRR